MSTLTLELAQEFFQNEVLPRANEMDGDVEVLRVALQGLCERNLMALRRPTEYGGPAWAEGEFRAFQEEAARTSGSLAFLQTQHQSAVSMIARGAGEEFKQSTLPLMGDGRLLMGIGFSQLRRPGQPVMRAELAGDDYLLEGEVPWITGFGLFSEFLIGAQLPDGQAVFGRVPLQSQTRAKGRIEVSEPMRLMAMESAQTVSAKLTNWRMTAEETAFFKPAGWIQNNDMINVTLQGFFALGCARAGLDVVEEAAVRRKSSALSDHMALLNEELERCRTEMMESNAPLEDRLKVRAWGIDLAVRCAHAGVAATGGFANSLQSRAQRVYREALVYTVSAQTSAIMEATLDRLVRRS